MRRERKGGERRGVNIIINGEEKGKKDCPLFLSFAI
jgi:hypothetical protein